MTKAGYLRLRGRHDGRLFAPCFSTRDRSSYLAVKLGPVNISLTLRTPCPGQRQTDLRSSVDDRYLLWKREMSLCALGT